MKKTAQDVIDLLNLVPLPEEGGFFKETYRSQRYVDSETLGKRTESTCIYYLITEDSFSALHKVDMCEIFHFYAGSPVEMFQIHEDGTGQIITLGSNIFDSEIPQVIVKENIWQGTKLKTPSKDAWALLGCTVAPGFELKNFHLESRQELIENFPKHKDQITKYTNE